MLMHRRDRLATRCSAAWRVGTFALCSLALAAAVGLAGARPARAQPAPDDTKPVESQSIRPVAVVPKPAEKMPSADELNAQLYGVLSRIKELQGQARRAQEEDKATEKEIYRAQLKQAEAEKALYESQLQKLKSTKDRDDDADPAKQDADVLKRQLRSREEELAKAQEQLAEQADRSKLAEAKGREARDAREQLDMLKKQIVEMNLRVNDQHNRSSIAERELASKLNELKAREQRLQQSEAQLRAQRNALDQEMKKQAQSLAKASSEDDKRLQGAAGAEKLLREARFKRAQLAGELPGVDPAAGAGGGKLAGGTLDLVALATSYTDAVGNVQVAKLRVRAAAEKDERIEEQIQMASLDTAQRKARLLRSIAEVAMEGAKAELEQSHQLAKQGVLPQSKLAEAEAKLRILNLILDDGGQGGQSGGNNKGQRR